MSEGNSEYEADRGNEREEKGIVWPDEELVEAGPIRASQFASGENRNTAASLLSPQYRQRRPRRLVCMHTRYYFVSSCLYRL